MIDSTTESMVPLMQAGRVANPSNPPHGTTAYRWAMRGCRGVRLETVLIGGQRFTSKEAVLRFIRALNGAPVAEEPEVLNRLGV